MLAIKQTIPIISEDLFQHTTVNNVFFSIPSKFHWLWHLCLRWSHTTQKYMSNDTQIGHLLHVQAWQTGVCNLFCVCVVRLEIVLNMWTILTVHRSTFYMHSMNNTDHLSITKRIEWQKCLTANTLTARYSRSLSLYYLECFVITVCGGTKIRHTNDQTKPNHTIPFSFRCVSIYVYKCILRWKSQDRNAQIGTIECSLTPQFWNSNGMKSIKHSTISSSHDLPHLSRFVRRLFVFLAYKMDLVVESILLLVY